jgi:carboxylesterase type B
MHLAEKICLGLLLCQPAVGQNTSQHLPRVDLGYEIHEALSFNVSVHRDSNDSDGLLRSLLRAQESAQLYNFSNIRYAQPPTGNLRFAAPVPPTGRNPVVQRGAEGRVCPQAQPDWQPIATAPVGGVMTYNAYNLTNFSFPVFQETHGQEYLDASSEGRSNNSQITEDCLFLDVVVPKDIFDGCSSVTDGGGAPVLVW